MPLVCRPATPESPSSPREPRRPLLVGALSSLLAVGACTINNVTYTPTSRAADAGPDALTTLVPPSYAQDAGLDVPVTGTNPGSGATVYDAGSSGIGPVDDCPSDRVGLCIPSPAAPVCPGEDPRPDINANGVRDCLENLLSNGQFPLTPNPNLSVAPWVGADGTATILYAAVDDFGSPASGSGVVDDTVATTSANGGNIESECIVVAPGETYLAYARYFLSSSQPWGPGDDGVWITWLTYSDTACAVPYQGISGSPQGAAKDAWSTCSDTLTLDGTTHAVRLQLGVLKGETAASVEASFDNVLFVPE